MLKESLEVERTVQTRYCVTWSVVMSLGSVFIKTQGFLPYMEGLGEVFVYGRYHDGLLLFFLASCDTGEGVEAGDEPLLPEFSECYEYHFGFIPFQMISGW